MASRQVLTFAEILQKMAAYCAYQDRCHMEVEAKMREFSPEPEAYEKIYLYLMENRYLDEERFARSYARGKFYQKKWGRLKIKNGLRLKNISGRLVLAALSEIPEEDYRQAASALIRKKSGEYSSLPEYAKRQKIYRYLLSKGYEGGVAAESLSEYFSGEPE